jgi:hypothetical protein
MILHLVLFQPRTELSDEQRARLVDAFERALDGIPQIRRARVGRRLTLGRVYDTMNTQDFPFVALLEFDSEDDLRAYLDHPAHEQLGEQFYVTSGSGLAFDFELIDAREARRLL